MLSKIKQLWESFLIAGLLIYAVLSVFYQVTYGWQEANLGMEHATFDVAGHYCVAIRYPKEAPIKLPGDVGRPVAVWMWNTPCVPASYWTPSITNSTSFLSVPKTVIRCNGLTTTIFSTVITNENWQVLIYPQGDNVLLTDKNGMEIGGVYNLKPNNEAESIRATYYLSRLPNTQTDNAQGALCVEVWQDGILQSVKSYALTLESLTQARLKRLGNLILNTPALSWISALAVMYSMVRKGIEKRAEVKLLFEEKLKRLAQLPFEEAWRFYWELYRDKNRRDREKLRQTWRDVERNFSPYTRSAALRRWLIEKFSLWQKEPHALLTLKTIQETVGEAEITALISFFHTEITPTNSPQKNADVEFTRPNSGEERVLQASISPKLSKGLTAFRILGLASEDLILTSKQLKFNLQCYQDSIKDLWYDNGGAAGQFLLDRWAIINPIIRTWLEEWRTNSNQPEISNNTCGPCLLWRSSTQGTIKQRLISNSVEELKISLDFTPFGPPKAENDPRLPTLSSEKKKLGELGGWFWNGYDILPWKEKLEDQTPRLFYAPHGYGRTAAIWMARHRYRVIGYEPALSIYLPLYEYIEGKQLLRQVTFALAEALLCAVVGNPYWLLAADREVQQLLAGILLYHAGGHTELLRLLQLRGLSIASLDDPKQNEPTTAKMYYDGQLLAELLHHFMPLEKPNWDNILEATQGIRIALRATNHALDNMWTYPIFLWIDCQNTINPHDISMLWKDPTLRKLGYLKLFSVFSEISDETIHMTWTKEALQAMTRHRFERASEAAKSQVFSEKWLGKGWHLLEVSSQKEAINLLTKRAKSPLDVITLGNEWLSGEVKLKDVDKEYN